MFDWEILAIERMASQGLGGNALLLSDNAHNSNLVEEEQLPRVLGNNSEHGEAMYGDANDFEEEIIRPSTSNTQRYQGKTT